MPRDKKIHEMTIKLSKDHHAFLGEAADNQRQRTQVLENIIEIFKKAAKERRFLMKDVLRDPDSIKIFTDGEIEEILETKEKKT